MGKLTGKTKVNESTGRGPDLQETDKPSIIRSKRPREGFLFSSPSTTDGTRSNST